EDWTQPDRDYSPSPPNCLPFFGRPKVVMRIRITFLEPFCWAHARGHGPCPGSELSSGTRLQREIGSHRAAPLDDEGRPGGPGVLALKEHGAGVIRCVGVDHWHTPGVVVIARRADVIGRVRLGRVGLWPADDREVVEVIHLIATAVIAEILQGEVI